MLRSRVLMLCSAFLGFGASQAYGFDMGVVGTHVKMLQAPSAFVRVSDDPLQKGAESFIDQMANEAIGFLGNADLSEAQKASRFRKLLRAKFDMKTIGRFALGRHWRGASAAQKKEYQSLFENMIVEVYAARFGDYQGQALEVRSSRKDSERDVSVQSYIVPDSGPEIQVDWRVRKKDGRYRVVDVSVEGVSMAVTQRSEFSSVIQRGGGEVAVLLAHLSGDSQ
ncbi:MAG: MlaC/ttg2D family ABC transporter substrate-binding protein [Alphaproteobacteria bacterium]